MPLRDRTMLLRWLAGWLSLALVTAAPPVGAKDVQVAVAANFAARMQRIAAEFAKDTKHDPIVVTGATGTLYAQIRNAAPFEVLLAATGNAELGFVALSQVVAPGQGFVGSYWLVPTRLYSPIRQDAVLVERGANNPPLAHFAST
jgi:ABC-type molybdate transport system substrate-binding protein